MASWNDDRLELALRASKEGVWDWDLEKGTIRYSRRALRFFGFRRDFAPNVFANRKEHMDEESAAAVDEALRRVCQEGEDLFAVESRIKTSAGKWKWFRVRGTPVRGSLGKVIRIVGSLIDISKRKAAEEELGEERALIKTLLDSIPMNIYFKDLDSRFVMANLPTALKMGLSAPEELLGKTDYDFFSAEHADHARAVEKEIMATGVGFSDVTEHEIWEDREDTWVKTTKHAWRGRTGKVKGTFGVTSDITELMQARAEQERVASELHALNSRIEEERQRMRLVIDGVPMNVYFKNLDHQFVIVNHSMAEWVGRVEPEDLYEKSDRDLFSEEHWRAAEGDEKRIMETGEPIIDKVEKETWRGKGDTWVMTSKYPWRDSEGLIMGTFGVSSDVSDLVLTQQELKAKAETLRKKNLEMAEELDLAREVQQALLPEDIPEFRRGDEVLRFSKLYRSAPDLAGDFFEVVSLGPDKAGFFICDVAGQGVRSALIVSMLRGLIEKQMLVAGSPGDFLTGLNEGLKHLLAESGVEILATAVYGVVDLAKGEIQLSVAGHPNPVAVFEEGVRQLVPPGGVRGPALGQQRGVVYQSVTAPLEGLRRMICFSNGLQKATNAEGEEFGVSRIIGIVERGGPLPRVLEQLSKSVVKFTEGAGEFRNALCLLAWEVEK
ncbi:PAS domain-containing protein [Verrucomicrobiaceae bacterium 227]